ncbi:hypothetical protein DC522_28780 [Microvirga sp. KLBC 81]|nr:hypothetical protein DC522_28780 [Microvirga sp. KLBC 81]
MLFNSSCRFGDEICSDRQLGLVKFKAATTVEGYAGGMAANLEPKGRHVRPGIFRLNDLY